MTERKNEFDFAAFRDAFERKDPDRRVPFYADDAEWIEYLHSSSARAPNRMIGEQQTANFLRGVCSVDSGISIADEVIAANRVAFSVDRNFPSGKHVFEHVIAQIKDVKITHQVDVEAWDEEE
jgi:hypothetical protein